MGLLEKRRLGSYQCLQIPEGRVQREQSQAHFNGAQWQDQRQRPQRTSGNTFSLWGWQSTGTGCPKRLWSLYYWIYSEEAIWTQSWASSSGSPCLNRGVWPRWLPGSLPTSTTLWFNIVLFPIMCPYFWSCSPESVSWKTMEMHLCHLGPCQCMQVSDKWHVVRQM